MFILKTMDGNQYKITEEEYKKAIVGDGLLVFQSCGVTINKSRIESIFPESMADEVETKKALQTGRLHDGTCVRRHFGEWVDADNMAVDEKGNYAPVKLDKAYYPEIALDKVFTEKEFVAVKHLPPEERLKLLTQGDGRLLGIGEPTSITNLLANDYGHI
jgi:hypothetical protein